MRDIRDGDGRRWTVSQLGTLTGMARLVFEATEDNEVRILGGVAPATWRDCDTAQLVAWLEMARPLIRG